MKTISLSVGDCVVLKLENGDEQSATVTHFSPHVVSSSGQSHVRAHFSWRTGPNRCQSCAVHSTKWADRVLAVFPKDSKFLVIKP